MSLFLDTSGLLAILDRDDQYHAQANGAWQKILSSPEELISTNYVLVETFALVQHRLGMEAVQTLQEDIIPVIEVEWVTQAIHQTAVGMLLKEDRRRLSLVDCVSFVVMHQGNIRKVFAFDHHFEIAGYERYQVYGQK